MLKMILWLFIILFLFTAMIYLMQRSMIYFPARTEPERDTYYASDMEKIRLQTKDGLSLFAWYKPAKEGHSTVVYFHGNAGHIGYRMPLARQWIKSGYGIILLEYRGYAGNPGKPSEKGLYIDGAAALDFLLKKGIKSQQIILYGESIGSAVATQLAQKYLFCAVILQSPMLSLVKTAKFHYPWLLIEPWDKFDSLERIAEIKAPLLILHGKEDNIVPYSQGSFLYTKANEPKKLVSFEGRGHNDLWHDEFFSAILQFMQEHGC